MKWENSRKYKARRRRAMFKKQDGKCHWCQCDMIMPPEGQHVPRMPKNMATIEHLRDRFSWDRQEPNINREFRWVLACLGCNNRRGHERQAELIDIQRAKSMAGHADKAMRRLSNQG